MSARHANRASVEAERALRDIQSRLEGNQFCADCGTTRPEYLNLTIGTFICDLCADIHRTSSNRRIKDMYGGDLTTEDVIRMEKVGNEIANRKFLATWNPHEVPEPDRRDKDGLREFLWLKYEGNFKKKPAPTPPPPRPAIDRDRYYDSRGDDRRDYTTPYRREEQLFRDPQPVQDPSRSYWSTRFGEGTRQPQRPLPQAPPRRDDYYRRGEGSGQPLPDRYRSAVPSDRFRPPQPAPLAPYDLARGAMSRYPDPYDDYSSRRSYERDRRYAPNHPTRYEELEQTGYSDKELESNRTSRTKKGSKGRRKTSGHDRDSEDYYYEDEEDQDVISERRSKKSLPKSKKKSSKDSRKIIKSKRRAEEEESAGTTSSSYDDEDEDEEQEEIADKRRSRRKGKSSKRKDREVDSVKSLEDDAVPPNRAPENGKKEFDLMSDWMGDSKDTEGSQTVPPPIAGTQGSSALPTAMHQAYQTVPMMPQMPMAMYNSVMPMPGGGFMPMMPPGFVPGIPMQRMHGMPPVMPSVMDGMTGTPGVPGANSSGVSGLINGMNSMNLAQNLGARSQGVGPPAPPPLGVPAGPPPGPPPEPLQE